jgi:hypothetical protein
MTPESERVFRRGRLATVILSAGLVALLALDAHSQEIATSDPALICGKVDGMSYSRQHRKLLLEDERKADFARYGVPWSEHRNYELDHVVPLCLGGADTPKNRRPQRCGVWEGISCEGGPAKDKDIAESVACMKACSPALGIGLQRQVIKREQALFANWKDW